eukprot:10146291-Karenia_brevis.AAC.1
MFRENKIAKALYYIVVDHQVMGMLITHVDYLCWAVKPGYEIYMDQILEALIVNKDKIKIGSFRFCGKEIEQFADFSIK